MPADGLDNISLLSFAKRGRIESMAAKVFSVKVKVQAILNKLENMSLTQDVPLDGSTAIEVKYL